MLSIYRDDKIQVFLQDSASSNAKTGDTANLWIRSVTGDPAIACLACPRLALKKCYAWRGRPGLQIRKIVDSGSATQAQIQSAIRGRMVRSAVIGDSGAIPVEAWQTLAPILSQSGMVGYTHAWRTAWHLRENHMASVESLQESQEAAAAGWRYFAILPSHTKPWKGRNDRNEIACPSWASGGKVTCVQCRYCDGANGTGKAHVAIAAHGAGIKN